MYPDNHPPLLTHRTPLTFALPGISANPWELPEILAVKRSQGGPWGTRPPRTYNLLEFLGMRKDSWEIVGQGGTVS